MRRTHPSCILLLAAGLVSDPASAGAALSRSGPIDKPPAHTNHWCPLTLPTFVADGTEVTVVFTADTFRNDGFWQSHTFDDVSLVPLPVYNANVSFVANCDVDCFGNALLHQQVPPASLTHFESFDSGIGPGWNLGHGGYFGAQGNSTRISAMTVIGDCNSRTGGWLGVGRKSDTAEYASAALTIGGLTPGESYVLSYWHAAISGLHWVDVYGAGFTGPYLCDTEEFVATDVAAGDAFGHAVDAHEDVAAVGFPSHAADDGAVTMYRNRSGMWHEEQTLLPLPGSTASRFGASVAVFGDVVAIGAPGDDDRDRDAGAVYLYRYAAAAGTWNFEAKLVYSDGVGGDQMGWSVDLDGDVLVTGVPWADFIGVDAGLALVHRHDGLSWGDEYPIVPTGAGAQDHFGWDVAHQSGILVVGMPDRDDQVVDQGTVRLFEFSAGTWVAKGELESTTPQPGARFGAAVALSNDRLAVGAPGEDIEAEDAGGVHTYLHAAAWTLSGRIAPASAAAFDAFGSSVAILDQRLLAGAPFDDGVGSMHLFGWAGLNWGPVDTFTPSTVTAAGYGAAVALTDLFLLSGAPDSDSAGAGSGAAFVHLLGDDCNGSGAPDTCDIASGVSLDVDCDGLPDECVAPQLPWQLSKLWPNDGVDGDEFGEAVDADGDVIVVGSSLHDHLGADDGSATVYRFDGTSYVLEQEVRPDDGAPGDRFGRSVALSGNWLAVGAHGTDDLGTNSGSVYLFWYNGVSWDQIAELWASDGGNDYNFGRYVALDGDVLAASAALPQGGPFRRPAAYVFEANGPVWSQKAKLTPSPQQGFEDLGHPVAVSGGRLVLGSQLDNASAGVAYVYAKDVLGTWTTAAVVSPPGGGASNGGFGVAVALSGDVLVVGAQTGTNPQVFDSGAYVYRYDPGSTLWNYEALLHPSTGDRFTAAVAVDGDVFVGGTPRYFGKEIEQGAAFVFRHDGVSWNEEAKLTHADREPVDHLGEAVAVAGGVVVAGCQLDDDDGSASGSAYVFGAGDDCNGNGIPDGLDLISGQSSDEDANGIPDECDTAVEHPVASLTVARLYPNVPNPFNPATVLWFEVGPAAAHVRLSIVDVTGRRVRTLVDEAVLAGRHQAAWHGRDDRDRLVASGVYLAVLETAHSRATRKITLLR